MTVYKGTYQDKFGTKEIEITNDFKSISFRLDGFNFISGHFDDFWLEDHDRFTTEQLRRFTFISIDIYQSDKKVYELRDFILSFTVPVTILNSKTKQATNSNLFIKLDIGSNDKETEIHLKIVFNDKVFLGTSGLFEGAADQINKQINGEFIVKNCFWCLYSDYGVYGQELAGSMLCFLKYKDKYVDVKDKDAYRELPSDIPSVQEIYYCDSFEPRKTGTGYRG